MSVLSEALKMYGVKEIRGRSDNPNVLELFNELGFDGSKLKDETAWCAAYANTILKRAGKPYQNTLNARSFLNIGKSTQNPKVGDIVVLWRESPSSWKGHVGFFIKATKNYIYMLGGNQRDMVCIKAYPKNRLLDYRTI